MDDCIDPETFNIYCSAQGVKMPSCLQQVFEAQEKQNKTKQWLSKIYRKTYQNIRKKNQKDKKKTWWKNWEEKTSDFSPPYGDIAEVSHAAKWNSSFYLSSRLPTFATAV